MTELYRGELTNMPESTYSRGGAYMTDTATETATPAGDAVDSRVERNAGRQAILEAELKPDLEEGSVASRLRESMSSGKSEREILEDAKRSRKKVFPKKGNEQIARAYGGKVEDGVVKKDGEVLDNRATRSHEQVLKILNLEISEETDISEESVEEVFKFFDNTEFTRELFPQDLPDEEKRDIVKKLFQNADYRRTLHRKYSEFVNRTSEASVRGKNERLSENEKKLEDAKRRQDVAKAQHDRLDKEFQDEFVRDKKLDRDGNETEEITLGGELRQLQGDVRELLKIDDIQYSASYDEQAKADIEQLNKQILELSKNKQKNEEQINRLYDDVNTIRKNRNELQAKLDSPEYKAKVERISEIEEIRKEKREKLNEKRKEASDITVEVSGLEDEKRILEQEAGVETGEGDEEVIQEIETMLYDALSDYVGERIDKGMNEYEKILKKQKEEARKTGDEKRLRAITLIENRWTKREKSQRLSTKGGLLRSKEVLVPKKEQVMEDWRILLGERGPKGVLEEILRKDVEDGNMTVEEMDKLMNDEEFIKKNSPIVAAHLMRQRIAVGGISRQMIEEIGESKSWGQDALIEMVKMDDRAKEQLDKLGIDENKLKELWNKMPKKSTMMLLSLLFLGIIPTAGIYLYMKKGGV